MWWLLIAAGLLSAIYVALLVTASRWAERGDPVAMSTLMEIWRHD